MRFSIITISYQQAPFLEMAIRSVLDQDYPDVEYIVVDPGSTDGSRDIIERYRHRLHKVILQPDDGPSDGLNKGVAYATGDIFGFINSDDALLPGALTSVANCFRKRPDADVVSGHLFIVDESNGLIRRHRASQFDIRRFAYGGVQVAQQSTFIRAEAFKQVGGFNRENVSSWDGELMLDLALAGKKFFVIDDYFAIFRIHRASISGSGRLLDAHLKDRDRYFSKAMKRLPTNSDRFWRGWYRIEKWIRDPIGFVLRISDQVVSPFRSKVIGIKK